MQESVPKRMPVKYRIKWLFRLEVIWSNPRQSRGNFEVKSDLIAESNCSGPYMVTFQMPPECRFHNLSGPLLSAQHPPPHQKKVIMKVAKHWNICSELHWNICSEFPVFPGWVCCPSFVCCVSLRWVWLQLLSLCVCAPLTYQIKISKYDHNSCFLDLHTVVKNQSSWGLLGKDTKHVLHKI